MSHYVTLCFPKYGDLSNLVLDWCGMRCQQTTATYAIMSRTSYFKDMDASILYVAIDGPAGNF